MGCWGHLPFDKSSADITAHVIRALSKWKEISSQIPAAIDGGFNFLTNTQGDDGQWVPLWFGNQHTENMDNPVFGTSRVLSAFGALGRQEEAAAQRGLRFLLNEQKEDGSWGGNHSTPSSIEETAVALEALSYFTEEEARSGCHLASRYLCQKIDSGEICNRAPIGLYFAKLWYSEKLYPIIWSASALNKLASQVSK